MYMTGGGIAQDFPQAAHWFRLAAEAGQPNAQNDLGVMYCLGQGVPQDFKEAARLVQAAAKQGLASAQANLGYLYEHGQGLQLDYVTAFAWYTRASSGGNHDAAIRLASLRQIMTPKQLNQAAGLLANPLPAAGESAATPAPNIPTAFTLRSLNP